MKKIDLAQSVGILANIGVIVGIIFLTVEIAQNNDQLASQTRNTIFELRAGLERDVVNNAGGIADLLGKMRRGEALTDVEQIRLDSRRFQLLQTFQYMFQEGPDGVRLQVPYMIAIRHCLIAFSGRLIASASSLLIAFLFAKKCFSYWRI